MKNIYFFLILLLSLTQTLTAQQWSMTNVPHNRTINSVIILDTMHIVVGGGNETNDSLFDIFKTNDGGFTFDFSSNGFGYWIKSMNFTDAVNGIAVGYSGKILKTTDGAVSWATMVSPISDRNYNKVVYKD